MAFNGNEGEQISVELGAEFTARHRAENPDGVKGVFFGKDHIEKLIRQGGCKGLRFYFAKNVDGSQTLVMVGADADENDMLNMVFEMAKPCPDRCSVDNPLNSGISKV